MNKDENIKIVKRSSTLKHISNRKSRQPSMESHKVLPLVK